MLEHDVGATNPTKLFAVQFLSGEVLPLERQAREAFSVQRLECWKAEALCARPWFGSLQRYSFPPPLTARASCGRQPARQPASASSNAQRVRGKTGVESSRMSDLRVADSLQVVPTTVLFQVVSDARPLPPLPTKGSSHSARRLTQHLMPFGFFGRRGNLQKCPS